MSSIKLLTVKISVEENFYRHRRRLIKLLLPAFLLLFICVAPISHQAVQASPGFGDVIDTLPLPTGEDWINGITWSDEDNAFWVISGSAPIIYKLDGGTGAVLSSIPAPACSYGSGLWAKSLAWDGATLWTMCGKPIGPETGAPPIFRLDPISGEILDTFSAPLSAAYQAPGSLAWDGNHLWVAESGANLFELDINGNVVGICPAPIEDQTYAFWVAGMQGMAYDLANNVLYLQNQWLWKYDPATCAQLGQTALGPGGVLTDNASLSGGSFDGCNYWTSSVNEDIIGQPVPGELKGVLLEIDVGTPSIASIKTVAFEEKNSPLDANPNAGGGLRIFPGKTAPADATDRRTVKVRAKTCAPNATIYFKAFDVDDPSTDSAPVDDNGSSGDDNRGTPNTGILSAASALTDANGVAEVEFTVTMHPGDNFKIAASGDKTYLDGITVDGTRLKDANGEYLPTGKAKVTQMLTVWRKFHTELDAMGTVSGNVLTGKISRAHYNTHQNRMVLTLDELQENGVSVTALEKKRFEFGRLRVLNGTTEVLDRFVITNGRKTVTLVLNFDDPPASSLVGKTFTLVDDDDYNSDDLFKDGDEGEALNAPSAVFARMLSDDDPAKNAFAPAYIRPVYDGAGVTNDRDNVAFALNVKDDTTAIENQTNLGHDSAGNEADDYWVVYIQEAYQGDINEDGDPNTEAYTEGTTLTFGTGHDATSEATVPQGGDVSLLFLEVLSENPASVDTVVVHEVGHQFGLAHGPTHGNKCGWGIMNSDCSSDPKEFIPRHLNVLRWRVKSPGQP